LSSPILNKAKAQVFSANQKTTSIISFPAPQNVQTFQLRFLCWIEPFPEKKSIVTKSVVVGLGEIRSD